MLNREASCRREIESALKAIGKTTETAAGNGWIIVVGTAADLGAAALDAINATAAKYGQGADAISIHLCPRMPNLY
jgi:azurin